MNLRNRYKHLLDFFVNLVIVVAEGLIFAYMWYTCYSETILKFFFVALYILILSFFTYLYNGYKISYMRITDIILSHMLAIVCSGIVTYIQICIIVKDYVGWLQVTAVCICEMIFVLLWICLVRLVYRYLYSPKQMLLIYGEYSPSDLISKINTRKDSYNICVTVSCQEKFEKVVEMIDAHEEVVLCDLPADVRNDYMKYCYDRSIRTYVTPKISDLLLRSAEDIHLFDSPLLLIHNQEMTLIQSWIKRLFDIVISLLGIVIAFPFMLLIACAVKAYDGGPVLYKQARLTKGGREFIIYKFRSMSVSSEVKGVRMTTKNDSRVTPVGRVIRNIHFDELPQLFNILKGDMSVVGPRPELKQISDKYLQEIPEFDMRLKVKAGLTGYAQVYGKYNTTPYDKLKLDLTYINNYSFWLDVKIMFLTFKILFQKEKTEGIAENQVTASKK